jgi:hypothetical protein
LVIVDCTIGGLTAVPVVGSGAAVLGPVIHDQGDRVKKAKAKKWDALQVQME